MIGSWLCNAEPGGGRELRPLGKRERRPHISALVQAIQYRPKATDTVVHLARFPSAQ